MIADASMYLLLRNGTMRARMVSERMPVPILERYNVCRALKDGSATAVNAREVWLGIQDSNLD